MVKPNSAAVRGTVPATGQGAAGPEGDTVRSDLWVSVELRSRGGLELDVESRVDSYYGDSIREQLHSILGKSSVEHARVEMRDQGALPYVIAARVEAALLRAGVSTDSASLTAGTAARPDGSAKDRLRRSRLYLPGNEPRYFPNAGLHGADGIIFDLEDSVHPDHKDAARLLVRNALCALDFGDSERMVRINPWPLGHEDLKAVVPQLPDLILIPKVESAEQVRQIDAAISEILDSGKRDRPLWLMPILESALGVERAFDIARSSNRVAALTLGLEDYAADLGVSKSASGDESLYARSRVVNAARAAGLQAIDSVYGQVDDVEGLRLWCERSRQLGFSGMGCLHPRQIEVIHRGYSPTAAEIDKALRIVAAFEEAQVEGRSVVSLGSKMIDPPVIKQAQRVVDLARDLGLIESQGAD